MSRDCYDDDVEQYELVEDQIEEMELLEERERINELEIPDVPWKEDIEKIPDHDLQLEEIRKAEKLENEAKALKERRDRGEISAGKYDVIYQDIIRPKMRKATTRCGLASVGLTYDDLGDLSEDTELLATGDLKMPKLKDKLKDTIEDIGPDAAEDLAKRMHDEDAIGDDAYDSISRQIRIRRRRKGQ